MLMQVIGNHIYCGVQDKLQTSTFLLRTMLGLINFAGVQFNWFDTLWLFVSVIWKINNETIRHFLLRHNIQLFCGLVSGPNPWGGDGGSLPPNIRRKS